MKHLLNKQWISVDLETLSTKQNGVIVSIGACKFTITDGISDEFSVNIDADSSIEFGLTIESSTVEWWLKQPSHIRKAWQTDKQQLQVALNQFNIWLGDCKNVLMLANGSVFDFGLLRSSYEATCITRPWPYWNEIDLRTISTLLNIKLSKGNEHTALGDAKNQAQQFISMFKD